MMTSFTSTAKSSGEFGPEQSFDDMVQRYRRRLIRVALRILGNPEDAEDAVQETFLKAFEHLDSFRGDSAVSTWLTRIVMNQALMQIRRKKCRPCCSIDDLLSEFPLMETLACPTPTAESLLLKAERQSHLLHMLSCLPESLRSVTEDRVFSESSITEIANAHGISQPAAKSRLLRARTALRGQMLNGTPPRALPGPVLTAGRPSVHPLD